MSGRGIGVESNIDRHPNATQNVKPILVTAVIRECKSYLVGTQTLDLAFLER